MWAGSEAGTVCCIIRFNQHSWLNTFKKIWWKRYLAFSPAQHLPCRKTSKHKNNSKPQLQCQSDLSWGDLRNPSVFNLDFYTDLELVLLHRPSSLKANSTFLCCESMCLSFLKIESVMEDLCVSILFVWVRKCVFICRLPVSVAHVLLFFGNILISDEWVRHSQRFYSCVVRPRSKSELSAVLLCVFRSFCLCPQDCPRLCNCASLLNSQVLHCLTFSWGSCSSSVRRGKWAIFRLQHISQKDRTPGTISKEINEMKLIWYQITKNSSSIIHCIIQDEVVLQ